MTDTFHTADSEKPGINDKNSFFFKAAVGLHNTHV